MLTSDAVELVSAGPDWLQNRRRAAADRAAAAGLPSSTEELWRYTPIADLDIARFSPVAVAPDAVPAGFVTDDVISGAAAIVDFVDGHLVDLTVDPSLADGLVVERMSESGDVDDLLARTLGSAADVFTETNLAFAHDPIVVRISRGKSPDGAVVIRHHTKSKQALVCSRVVVVAGENSEATVVEVQSSADHEALVIPVTELIVEQAARLRYLAVQDLGPSVWQIGTQAATIDRDGYLLASTVALGGHYARVRTDTKMIGRGAEGDIMAIYLGNGDQTLDFRTFQQHVAPDTNSNLMFKGALDDRSRSIYTGLIRIEKEASGVTAFQTNRNVKLSDEAWAESVPNLEIENNDVKCSHASAVGPIDADQRFYLESRGVPADVADRLVIQGFFSEVLTQLPHAGIAELLDAELTARLQLVSNS